MSGRAAPRDLVRTGSEGSVRPGAGKAAGSTQTTQLRKAATLRTLPTPRVASTAPASPRDHPSQPQDSKSLMADLVGYLSASGVSIVDPPAPPSPPSRVPPQTHRPGPTPKTPQHHRSPSAPLGTPGVMSPSQALQAERNRPRESPSRPGLRRRKTVWDIGADNHSCAVVDGGPEVGRKLVASRKLERGESVVVCEAPFPAVVQDRGMETICAACFKQLNRIGRAATTSHCYKCKRVYYCSDACYHRDAPVHSYECSLDPEGLGHIVQVAEYEHQADTSELRLAIRTMAMHAHLVATGVKEGMSRLFNLEGNEGALSQEESWEMNRRASHLVKLTSKFQIRPFDSQDAISRLLSVIECNAVGWTSITGERIGLGLFYAASFCNHSCTPNACFSFSRGRMTIRVVNDFVHRGEEIVVAYTDVAQPGAARIAALAPKYKFTCKCEKCNGDDMSLYYEARIMGVKCRRWEAGARCLGVVRPQKEHILDNDNSANTPRICPVCLGTLAEQEITAQISKIRSCQRTAMQMVWMRQASAAAAILEECLLEAQDWFEEASYPLKELREDMLTVYREAKMYDKAAIAMDGIFEFISGQYPEHHFQIARYQYESGHLRAQYYLSHFNEGGKLKHHAAVDPDDNSEDADEGTLQTLKLLDFLCNSSFRQCLDILHICGQQDEDDYHTVSSDLHELKRKMATAMRLKTL